MPTSTAKTDTTTPSTTPAPVLSATVITQLFAKIDKGFLQSQLVDLFKLAGADEASSSLALFGMLRQLVLGDFSELPTGDGAEAAHQAALEKLSAVLDSGAFSGQIVNLSTQTAGQIANLAQTDIGTRYAITHFLPFTIAGAPELYARFNTDGSLSNFDPVTGERLISDQWLNDRSQLFTARMAAGSEADLNISGDRSYTFEDRNASHYRLQLNADKADKPPSRVTFGGDQSDGEIVAGGTGDDHLYGGAGDDNMRGGGGADYIEGGSGNDAIEGGIGNDVLLGGAGDDVLLGGKGDDYLSGSVGNDTLDGGSGNDVLEGGSDADVLTDTKGNNLLDGGHGTDTITTTQGNSIVIGGTAHDILNLGGGNDLVAFNRGDGDDTIRATGGGTDTLSLGGGIGMNDLQFKKNGNDLQLLTGSGDSLTFDNWYGGAQHSFVNLQMIEAASSDYDPNGKNALTNHKIETYNFAQLVAAFDLARVANPKLSKWHLMNGALDAHLSESDNFALGGDFAYQYGMNGNLKNVGLDPALALLANNQLTTHAQQLQSVASLNVGSQHLM